MSVRIKEQQRNLLEKSYTSYLREFENTQLTKQQIFQKFYEDILVNVSKLNEGEPIVHVVQEQAREEDKIETSCIITSSTESLFDLHDIDFCY